MSEGAVHALPVVDACWNSIGVRGDRSCPELAKVDHCHNCPVFAKAAEMLLDRPVDEEYLEERARFLAEPVAAQDTARLGAVVFDLGSEAYALESKQIVEVTELRAVHRVPHRTNAIFKGLVNVHGQLELCFSLAGLLGIAGEGGAAATDLQRVIVASFEGHHWVLVVDRVRGVHRFDDSKMREVPPSSARRSTQYVSSVLAEEHERIGLLDPQALRKGLEASLK